ncbi:MAG: glycosyltransferase family 39 protein [Candidatus Nanohaloarchaea archaeon]|nr:glycosyltransferase family 39 protein [Candidatus Nanohaloarchaea archaeon]
MDERLEMLVERKEAVVLAVITLAALLLRFRYAFISGMWVDEGRYALIATALLEHPLRYMSPFHGVITNYPPVFPYLLWLSMTVLGWGKTAVYSVSPVMGTLGVVVTYFLGREMFGKLEGLTAASLLAFSPVYFFLSERILIGVTLTFFYVLCMGLLYYGLEDREYSGYALWALGPVTALALLTKQPAYLMGPVFLIYFLLKEGRDVLKVREDPMRYRHLYVGVLLGAVTLAPWMLRNVTVCGSVLCSSSKALEHIFNTDPAAWTNTGGPLYYFINLPALVTFPVALLLAVRYIPVDAVLSLAYRDVKKVGSIAGLTVLFSVVALFTIPRTAPFFFLLGIGLLQDTDEERLLWLWIAFGVGFMSTVTIKVPRYVVFVVPALMLLTAKLLVDLRDMAARYLELEDWMLTGGLALVVLALSVFAAMNAIQVTVGSAGGFQKLEPAGRWFQGMEEPEVLASSPRQILFYSRNGPNVTIMPSNRTRTERLIRSGRYEFVVADLYERTRSKTVRYILTRLGRTDVLTPVRVYRERFRGRKRPSVVIYRVNATA